MRNPNSERRASDRNRPKMPEAIRIAIGTGAEAEWLSATLNDSSTSGVGISLARPLNVGAVIWLQIRVGKTRTVSDKKAKVAWCLGRSDGSYRAGLQFDIPAEKNSRWTRQSSLPSEPGAEPSVDHYETLQLSANADPETIHRVYRLLAQRLHPDNPDSGSDEKFKRLLESYRILSDPVKRASFDAERRARRDRQFHIFAEPSDAVGTGTEKHKRQLILTLLYKQRVQDPAHPHLTLHEMENLLGYPRDHLEVSLWFLREKGYLKRADNARFSITSDGFEYAEDQQLTSFAERRMLTAG